MLLIFEFSHQFVSQIRDCVQHSKVFSFLEKRKTFHFFWGIQSDRTLNNLSRNSVGGVKKLREKGESWSRFIFKLKQKQALLITVIFFRSLITFYFCLRHGQDRVVILFLIKIFNFFSPAVCRKVFFLILEDLILQVSFHNN